MKTVFRYQSNATDFWNLIMLNFMRHFTDTINIIMRRWNRWSWWSLEEAERPLAERLFLDKIISRIHQLQIMPSIRWFFMYQCCMINRHDTHNQVWKKIYGFYLNTKLQISLPLRPGRNYTVLLYNDLKSNLLVLFWTMCYSVKQPCDIKSFKISTFYDVWFSRYRPSNMKLTTDSALVLVFINFLWAVSNGNCYS